jgi:hypothetical protein
MLHTIILNIAVGYVLAAVPCDARPELRPTRLVSEDTEQTSSRTCVRVADSTVHSSRKPAGVIDPGAGGVRAAGDTVSRRRHAIEYSDWYARRLAIHRIGSYVEFPLFAAQYYAGEKLLTSSTPTQSMRGVHGALATSTALLFGVNTGTGLWNLWDSRHDPADRPRKFVHTALMIASDAGFMWTGALADEGDDGSVGFNAQRHRQVALGSMALSGVGTLMMWLWKH